MLLVFSSLLFTPGAPVDPVDPVIPGALDPRLIAVQGIWFPLNPVALAVQGFLLEIESEAKRSNVYGSGRVSEKGKARFYSDDAMDASGFSNDDQDAIDLIVCLVTQGFFDGYNT